MSYPINDAAIGIKKVCELLSLSKATVYRKLKTDPSFPRAFKLSGGKSVRWRASDVRNYIDRCSASQHRPPHGDEATPDCMPA